jgi:hypothetical protein
VGASVYTLPHLSEIMEKPSRQSFIMQLKKWLLFIGRLLTYGLFLAASVYIFWFLSQLIS